MSRTVTFETRISGGAALAGLLALTGAVGFVGCSSSPEMDQASLDAIEQHLASMGAPPIDYVIGLFDDHDVVLLGEHQLVRQDARFAASLVPALGDAGIVLAIEYACAEDQARIDAVVNEPLYDEAGAIAVQHHYAGGLWPYREYVEILKAAWDHNRHADQASRIRVIGLSPVVDWEAVNFGEGAEREAEVRKIQQTDAYMAALVQREVDAGRKVLVYCGTTRAFTDFVPTIEHQGDRVPDDNHMGHILSRSLGDRAVTVLLHQPWPGPDGALVGPADGRLNPALAALADSAGVGFDLAGPVGQLTETRSLYALDDADLHLSDVADGYVFLAPFAELIGVQVITSWVSEDEFEAFRRGYPNPRVMDEVDSVRRLVERFSQNAAIRLRFRGIE